MGHMMVMVKCTMTTITHQKEDIKNHHGLSTNNKIYNSIITTFCSSGAIHMMDMGKCITTTTMVHPTNIMIATMNQCTERLMKKQLFINQNHINQSHTNQNHLISQNQAILRL